MRILYAALALAACGPADRDGATPDGSVAIDSPVVVEDVAQPTSNARVYAHSGSTLYVMNPITLAAMPVGPLTGLDPMRSLLDLAIDRNGDAIGVSREKLYRVDTETGALTFLAELPASAHNTNSLSYAPTDPSDPNSPEILITANESGDVYKIDLSGVQPTPILMGNFGTHNGQQIRSSGDIVGIHGLGIFATVDIGDDRDGPDYLAQIDPVTWKATVKAQSTGFNRIYGLGYWDGRFYGFADNGFEAGSGTMIQIDPQTGAGIELSTADIRWFGAAVTTVVPIF
jgi:hypothetical protein